MLKQKLEIIIKFLVCSLFFVPLVIFPNSFIFPFIVPKVLWARSIVEIMVGVYILLLVINWRQYCPKFTPINIALLLYLFSFAISTFFGVDYYHSLWDNYERMLGLFTIFHYVVFYFISGGILRNWLDWKWASRIFLFAGFMVMFLGWFQIQNPQFLLNNGSERVSSTLGNPIYLGGYGVFLGFLAILLMSREKSNLWNIFYGVAGFFGFMAIFWSGTRGALLGIAAAVVFAIISSIILSKNSPKIRYGLLGASVLFVVLVSLLYYYKNTNFVKNIPAVGRTVNTSLYDIEGSPRWVAWEIAVESWKEKPMFGWGPNNYFYAFNKYYKAKSLSFGYQETWFDNAHNIVLNTLAVQGAFGLLVYVGVFVVAIGSLIKAYNQGRVDKKFLVIGGSFLVAHFFGNITVFENPTSYIYFMFWLAMISSLTTDSTKFFEGKEVDKKLLADKKLGLSGIVSASVLTFIFVLIFNINNASANQKNLLAIRTMADSFNIGNPEIIDSLAFSSPHIDDTRSNIAKTVFEFLYSNWQKLDKIKVNNLINLVTENLEKNLVIHPLDIRNQLMLAQLYQLQTAINKDGRFLIKTENILLDALSKSPKRQQIIYTLAGVEMQLNKIDEAVKLLEQSITDNPNVGEGYWRLGLIYKITGQEKKAEEIIKRGDDFGAKFSDQDKMIVSSSILKGYIFK